MSPTFLQHALSCGINMTGKEAIALFEGNGRLIMHPVRHPETGQVLLNVGTTMDTQLVEVCASAGVDYIVVYTGSHVPHGTRTEGDDAQEVQRRLLVEIAHLTALVATRNDQLDLLREDNAALNAAMQDDPLDHYPTCELMAALHGSVLHSNGLDFCERDTMLELAAMLRMEAVRRGNTPAL